MNGWLIVNGFLHTKKFSELTDLFLLAAKRCGVSLTVYTNCEILVDVQEKIKEKPDFVLFWDKDILLAKFLEKQKIPVYNSSEAIRICDDKRLTYLALQEKKIPFVKGTAETATNDIKASGFFVYYARRLVIALNISPFVA